MLAVCLDTEEHELSLEKLLIQCKLPKPPAQADLAESQQFLLISALQREASYQCWYTKLRSSAVTSLSSCF